MNTQHTPLTICGRTFEQYAGMVEAFHGHLAPGMVLGGLMVDLAYRHRPQADLLDAICETRHCLPDAVQLLTPCTVGNGWLRVVDLGRFALSLYAKRSGSGVRVSVDASRLAAWPEIEAFLFKLKAKADQDTPVLIAEIIGARSSILALQEVAVDLDRVRPGRRRAFAVCPECGEGHPADDGEVCRGCRGDAPYLRCASMDEAKG